MLWEKNEFLIHIESKEVFHQGIKCTLPAAQMKSNKKNIKRE